LNRIWMIGCWVKCGTFVFCLALLLDHMKTIHWSGCLELMQDVKFPKHADLDPEFQDLMLQLLQKDPAKRITFPEFFQHPTLGLELMQKEDVSAATSNPTEPAENNDEIKEVDVSQFLLKLTFQWMRQRLAFGPNFPITKMTRHFKRRICLCCCFVTIYDCCHKRVRWFKNQCATHQVVQQMEQVMNRLSDSNAKSFPVSHVLYRLALYLFRNALVDSVLISSAPQSRTIRQIKRKALNRFPYNLPRQTHW